MARRRQSATVRPFLFSAVVLLGAACGGRSPGAVDPKIASAPPASPGVTVAAATHPPAAEPIVELPRSPIGQLARKLVEVVNVGKLESQREFVRTYLTAQALEEAPVDEWATFLASMSAESGGIDVVKVFPVPMPDHLVFRVRSRRERHFAVVKVRANATSDRIAAFIALPTPDEGALAVGALEPRPVAEDEVIRSVTRRAQQRADMDLFSGAVLVVKGSRVLVRAAFGQADKAWGAPNRIDTKFNLGSMNKMFTAVAIGQLVERGQLRFADSLARVLPEYPDRAFAERVTVHQLLTHTSGIGGDMFMPETHERREHFRKPTDYLPLFAKQKPKFAAGERFEYANAGFVVLGAVVERLSDESYDDYVRKHIFAPANMRDTASYEIDEAVPNRAAGYVPPDNDPFGLKPRRTNTVSLPYKGTPAGGGYSTVLDLRAFADALRGHKLLGSATTETVTSPKVDALPGRRYGYGFWTRVFNGKEVRGHSGEADGINASLAIFWDGSYTVAVAGNYSPPAANQLADEIVEFLAAQTN